MMKIIKAYQGLAVDAHFHYSSKILQVVVWEVVVGQGEYFFKSVFMVGLGLDKGFQKRINFLMVLLVGKVEVDNVHLGTALVEVQVVVRSKCNYQAIVLILKVQLSKFDIPSILFMIIAIVHYSINAVYTTNLAFLFPLSYS